MRSFAIGVSGFIFAGGLSSLLYNEQVNKWAVISCFLGLVGFFASRELIPTRK